MKRLLKGQYNSEKTIKGQYTTNSIGDVMKEIVLGIIVERFLKNR